MKSEKLYLSSWNYCSLFEKKSTPSRTSGVIWGNTCNIFKVYVIYPFIVLKGVGIFYFYFRAAEYSVV